mmetsp:Transcript_38618/g.97227  ORF Transcript_38618/g.97227 Transcript_38618/m.97227 type:complete len:1150 (-) Transcript_38618:172-3621(-)|eukprot:CAMPEP_0177648954 /NCGR_PEP_ID=MMETSP0447-20121125/11108_1 /TAXON_ID=0 /ORGANISM="Stygamoeba regulata, Strain BSH-02190019" /LENGTH=1149 /DNA_ID=CAMNT_0019151639 /DNA_START=310 /DNA_END=3759 /DNA_ORIENTATION=+
MSKLFEAVNEGNAKLVQDLILHGADVRERDAKGRSMLRLAAAAGHAAVVSVLLTYGGMAGTRESKPVLHAVVERMTDEPDNLATYFAVIFLLAEKQPPDKALDPQGNSALHLACACGSLAASFFLFLMGASVNLANKSQKTPLSYITNPELSAFLSALAEEASKLVKKPSETRKIELFNILYKNASGDTEKTLARFRAPMREFDKLISVLEDERQIAKKESDCLFELAAANSLHELNRKLTTGSSPLTLKLPSRQTLMHVAAAKANFDLLRMLLDLNCNLDAADATGCTPLHTAIVNNERDFAEILIGEGANVRLGNFEGTTPLHYAVRAPPDEPFAYLRLLRQLLIAGADVNQKTKSGETALYQAAFSGREIGLLFLLRVGADPNRFTKSGFAPIHVACMFGQTAVVEILLEFGADVSVRSAEGTPLEVAQRSGHETIIRMLFYRLGISESDTPAEFSQQSVEANKRIVDNFMADANSENVSETWIKWRAKRGEPRKKTKTKGKHMFSELLHKGRRFSRVDPEPLSPNSASSPINAAPSQYSFLADPDLMYKAPVGGSSSSGSIIVPASLGSLGSLEISNLSPRPDPERTERRVSSSEEDPLEKFEIQSVLGEGAYGKVLQAFHKESGFTVALKTISVKEQEQQDDIEGEIRILSVARHPNIVQYYGCWKRPESISVLMELCEYGSILDVRKLVGSFTEIQVVAILEGVLKGLDYLHSNSIIHRDMKGQNILCAKEGLVKLADFGVSQKLDSAQEALTCVGTPLFMSPEVLNAETHSAATDIWSLGITAIQLADGVPPLHGQPVGRAMCIIAGGMQPPCLADPSKWSMWLLGFIDNCCQNDPVKRPTAALLLSHPLIANMKQHPRQVIEDMTNAASAKAGKKVAPVMSRRRKPRSPDESDRATLTCSTNLEELVCKLHEGKEQQERERSFKFSVFPALAHENSFHARSGEEVENFSNFVEQSRLAGSSKLKGSVVMTNSKNQIPQGLISQDPHGLVDCFEFLRENETETDLVSMIEFLGAEASHPTKALTPAPRRIMVTKSSEAREKEEKEKREEKKEEKKTARMPRHVTEVQSEKRRGLRSFLLPGSKSSERVSRDKEKDDVIVPDVDLRLTDAEMRIAALEAEVEELKTYIRLHMMKDGGRDGKGK